VRARRQVDAKRPRFEADRRRREELAQRFFEAVTRGDEQGLLGLLADDVVAYGDGGGKVPAIPQPVYGRDRVVRLMIGAAERGQQLGVRGASFVEINGQPGALFLDEDDRPLVAVTLDIADDVVQTIRAVGNPDKLHHLHAFGR
jgi:RNA polymerase sigma-70 factor (ECF subfamily)